MTPAEAGDIETEPDWEAMFDAEIENFPRLERYLAEDEAFERVLTAWRRWHWTPIEVNGAPMRQPASATDGLIALAREGIMPPRWLEREPHGSPMLEEQHDDHCWLTIAGEAWRIQAIESRMLILARAFGGETMQIDLNRAKWDKHNEAARAVLDAIFPAD